MSVTFYVPQIAEKQSSEDSPQNASKKTATDQDEGPFQPSTSGHQDTGMSVSVDPFNMPERSVTLLEIIETLDSARSQLQRLSTSRTPHLFQLIKSRDEFEQFNKRLNEDLEFCEDTQNFFIQFCCLCTTFMGAVRSMLRYTLTGDWVNNITWAEETKIPQSVCFQKTALLVIMITALKKCKKFNAESTDLDTLKNCLARFVTDNKKKKQDIKDKSKVIDAGDKRLRELLKEESDNEDDN